MEEHPLSFDRNRVAVKGLAIFGLADERLTILHDASSGAIAYLGGTLVAVQKVMTTRGLRNQPIGSLNPADFPAIGRWQVCEVNQAGQHPGIARFP